MYEEPPQPEALYEEPPLVGSLRGWGWAREGARGAWVCHGAHTTGCEAPVGGQRPVRVPLGLCFLHLGLMATLPGLT